MPLLYDIPNNNKPRHTMNEHVNPTIKAILDQFEPLAMAERYKAAEEPSDLKPTLISMMNAISHKNSINDPEYRYLLGAEIIMEYIYDWAGGGRTDKDLLELIEITVRGTQADVDKKAMAQQ
jgi:hypothetical protein